MGERRGSLSHATESRRHAEKGTEACWAPNTHAMRNQLRGVEKMACEAGLGAFYHC